MYQLNGETEINNIIDKLDSLPRHQRLSSIESDVETIVSKFRDSLNKDIFEKVESKVSDGGAMDCPDGHKSYSKNVKKKHFF